MPTSRISGCESMRLSPGDGGQPSHLFTIAQSAWVRTGTSARHSPPAVTLLTGVPALAVSVECLFETLHQQEVLAKWLKAAVGEKIIEVDMNMHSHFWWRGEAGFKMYMPVYDSMKNRFLLVEVYVLSIITRHPHVPGRVASVCPDMSHVSWSGSRVTSTQYSVQQGWETSHQNKL